MDFYTISDLARKTGLTVAKVKNTLKGVEPQATMSDGYYKLYSLELLRERLIEANADLLRALGLQVTSNETEGESE